MNFVLLVSALSVAWVGVAVGEDAVGVTTRYWDCCKPACGWGRQANVTSPVTTCDKDGVTAQAKSDVTNVCGGGGIPGKSYMCNSNQPWAVNSSLAFGFSAARILNQTPHEWCCSCYELTFTSGHVQGKKMVVQISNTGGDRSKNHFDLQIPGGGVGAYGKGCADQWGTSVDGWGKRYGGIGTDAECSQLPTELQAGCHFRFGWMAGASNPPVTLKRTQCPQSLVAKSHCTRLDDAAVLHNAYVHL